MSSLLYDIYSGEYDTTSERDAKRKTLGRKICDEWDKVQRMFGDEFMERLFALEAEREDWQAFQYYREGFRLGVRLMLEALTPS